ncbi:MAG: hypothetical protein N2045_13660 [Fimbriimonadales bacterium]|nr:hypothetical protein [Fimbriimonadales bacterium]
MSSSILKLVEALIGVAFDHLEQRFPGLPLAWAQQFARELAGILVQLANDPVQREAEIRGLYARIEELIRGEEARA